jgi:hypothetical protein
MNTESLISSILSKDGDSAVEAFNAAIASKIADALEVKKVEVASNFISAPAEAPAEQIEASTEA